MGESQPMIPSASLSHHLSQSNSGQMPAEKQIHPFWLVTTTEYEDIDAQRGHIEVKIFAKFFWRTESELSVDDRSFKDEGKSDFFPVNPSYPFKNWIIIESIHDLSWAKSEDKPYQDQGRFLNSAQKVYRAKLQTKLNMVKYPFDRHLVPIMLALRSWRGVGSQRGGKWELMQTMPKREWFVEETIYGEDKCVANVRDYWAFYKGELNMAGPGLEPLLEFEGKKKNKPVIYLKLERDPVPAIFYIAFPSFTIVSIVLMSLVGPVAEEDGGPVENWKMIGNGILSLLATQFATNKKLPTSSYVTVADRYMLISYAFLFFLGLKVFFVEYINSWTGKIDFIAGMVFVAFWGFLHLLILIEYMSGRKKWTGILSLFLRQGWDHLEKPSERWSHGDVSDDL